VIRVSLKTGEQKESGDVSKRPRIRSDLRLFPSHDFAAATQLNQFHLGSATLYFLQCPRSDASPGTPLRDEGPQPLRRGTEPNQRLIGIEEREGASLTSKSRPP
jgi:hypothetical protein